VTDFEEFYDVKKFLWKNLWQCFSLYIVFYM